MKKTTKPAKTLTPAKKPAKTVKKTPAAPAVKKAEPVAVVTKITASFDVGFGNALYLRGDGPGLSWDKGTPMDCVSDDVWSLTLPGTVRPVAFKFLINDETWSAGEDYSVEPGAQVSLKPTF